MRLYQSAVRTKECISLGRYGGQNGARAAGREHKSAARRIGWARDRDTHPRRNTGEQAHGTAYVCIRRASSMGPDAARRRRRRRKGPLWGAATDSRRLERGPPYWHFSRNGGQLTGRARARPAVARTTSLQLKRASLLGAQPHCQLSEVRLGRQPSPNLAPTETPRRQKKKMNIRFSPAAAAALCRSPGGLHTIGLIHTATYRLYSPLVM